MQVYYAVILLVFLKLMFLAMCWECRSAEYEINGECCPMCHAGERVYSHCSEDSSTTCVNCTLHTYTDVPNGLIKCLPCTVCDEGSGLRIKRECNIKANTLCEPLAGYYCTDLQENICRKARKHSTCLPGQFIYQNGTELADNVCQDCPESTYSNSSSTFCRPHTHCESMGMITVSVGTKTADSECSNLRSRLYSIISVSLILTIIIIILSVAFIICTIRKRRTEDDQRDRSLPQREQGNIALPQCEQGYKSLPQCEQGYKSLPQCEQRDRSPPECEQRDRSPPECEQGYKSTPQCEQRDRSPPECEQINKSPPECEQINKSPPECEQSDLERVSDPVQPGQSSGCDINITSANVHINVFNARCSVNQDTKMCK